MFFYKKIKYILMATTDVGNIRQINQDNVFVMEEPLTYDKLNHYVIKKKCIDALLCAVCDGMGGGSKGEEAALIAVKALKRIDIAKIKKLENEKLEMELKCYIQEVSNEIFNQFKAERNYTGCTITLLYSDGKRTLVLNVGDSPCFLVSKSEYKELSVSDNRANQLYQLGKISEEERWTHKTKNQLTQYLGMNSQEIRLSPHTYWGNAIAKEEYYLIASDGLIDNMELKKIEKIKYFKKSGNAAKYLVDMALQSGSRDNVSVIVVKREK